jgi:arylformamidase
MRKSHDDKAELGLTNDEIAEWRDRARASTKAFRPGFDQRLNMPFGSHPLQILDLYLPAAAVSGATMVFLHPGGFEFGRPAEAGHYGRAILEAGGIFVSMGYRLAPEVRFPDCAEDVDLGLAFLHHHAAELGIDPSRIFLGGYSAGAALSAIAASRPLTDPARAVAGLAVVSGNFEFALMRDETVNRSSPRYVPDLGSAIERAVPEVVVVRGEHDTASVIASSARLSEALGRCGSVVHDAVERDAGHFEAIRGFASPGAPVATAVAKMMGLDR